MWKVNLTLKLNLTPYLFENHFYVSQHILVLVLAAHKWQTSLLVYLDVNSCLYAYIPCCHLTFHLLLWEAPHTAVHDCLKKVVCQTKLLSCELSWTRHQSSHKLQETHAWFSSLFIQGFVWTWVHKHFSYTLMSAIE